MSFLNLPVRTLVAACGLSLLSLAAHADSFRGNAHAPQQAAVATPHPAATVAGLETLANGGNAFDAAAAIAAALAVAEPYGSGLGGGGFFLLRQAGAQPTYRFLDARERAPKAAYADMYRRNGKVDPRLSVDGPLAAAIPGLPAALVELSSRYGRKPLADNLVPAIRLAVDGVSVDRIYRDRAAMRLEAMRKDPETARIFLDKGGIPDEWNLLRQPQLARTLERLGRYGRIGFYEGETADKLLTGVRAGGGIWSAADLRDYRVIERRPLEVKLANGRELISAPPPSAGGVALAQSLQMLEQLPWQKAEPVQRAHYVLEVLRRAYRDRGLLGDPDFVANPLPSLLAPDYLKRLAAGIDPRRATPSSALPEAPAWREGDHTTHFAVIDAQGNAVAAGKRPLSSMSPSFLESPTDFAAFGTPGGSRIPSMVLISMLQYFDGRPVGQWVAAPRYHHQYKPDVVEYEPRAFSDAEAAELRRRGYQLKRLERSYGNQQVLYWDKRSGRVDAASDPRGIGYSSLSLEAQAQPRPH
ncbi:gamma-glutamyltransferase [Pseudomonas aeruginosa]|nr:gamma-glutamyltransferase [Pseudomonas aeruginosa]